MGKPPSISPYRYQQPCPALGNEGCAQDGLGALSASWMQEGAGIRPARAGLALGPVLEPFRG